MGDTAAGEGAMDVVDAGTIDGDGGGGGDDSSSSSDDRPTSGFSSSSSSSWMTTDGDGGTWLPALVRWAAGAAASLGAATVVGGFGLVVLGSGAASDAGAAREALHTGYPAGAACGNFTPQRTQVARDILTCNQDNWRENCLSHYAESLEYTDGPGLTHIAGKDQMALYLDNQFKFSRQFLTVTEETCAADTYIAQWSLDMDLGTGNLRGMPGISVLKFAETADRSDTVEARADEGASEERGSQGGGGAGADLNLVKYHRDYLPDGKIWENAPVVGPLVKFQRETYMGCMLSNSGCVELLGAPK